MATRKNRKQRKARMPKRSIRVIPKRRKQIDADQIAMAYWMIAKRVVQDREMRDEREGKAKAESADPNY